MAPSHMIRASLCCAAGFSQASVESSTLLQATRSKFTAGAGSASGTTASELRLVETMATQMVRSGEQVSPEVKAELKKLIDESLAASKEQIKTSHTADITGGNTIVTNYNNDCLSPFDTSQTAFANSLAATGATGLKHSSHKQCREQWRIDDGDRETKCNALEAMLASLRIQGQSALAVPSARTEFAGWWPKVKALAGRYDEWKQLNDACIAAENLEDATLAECNTKQGGFENAMCSQRQGVLSGCEAYDNCYAVSDGDLSAAKTDGLAGAASRKVEWEAIMKIECFVNLLLNEGGETQSDGSDKLTEQSLNDCKNLITNTAHLDLNDVFPVLPDKKDCVTSALDTYGGHPCEQSFLDTSYAGLADTNLATCVACATTPVPSADPRLSCGDDAVGAGVTSTVVTVEEGAQVWCNRDQYHFGSQQDEYWSNNAAQSGTKKPKLDSSLVGATMFMQQHKELPPGTYEFTNLPIGKTLYVVYERSAGQANAAGEEPRNGQIPARLNGADGVPGPIWTKGNHAAYIEGLHGLAWMDFHSKTITDPTFQLEITRTWVGFVAFK